MKLIVQALVALAALTGATVLGLNDKLDAAAITALYGTAIGAAGVGAAAASSRMTRS